MLLIPLGSWWELAQRLWIVFGLYSYLQKGHRTHIPSGPKGLQSLAWGPVLCHFHSWAKSQCFRWWFVCLKGNKAHHKMSWNIIKSGNLSEPKRLPIWIIFLIISAPFPLLGKKFEPATFIHMKVTFANVHWSQANPALTDQTVAPCSYCKTVAQFF